MTEINEPQRTAMSSSVDVIAMTISVRCVCKAMFEVTVNDQYFIQCPQCNDVAGLTINVYEHWLAYQEIPASEDIAVGKTI